MEGFPINLFIMEAKIHTYIFSSSHRLIIGSGFHSLHRFHTFGSRARLRLHLVTLDPSKITIGSPRAVTQVSLLPSVTVAKPYAQVTGHDHLCGWLGCTLVCPRQRRARTRTPSPRRGCRLWYIGRGLHPTYRHTHRGGPPPRHSLVCPLHFKGCVSTPLHAGLEPPMAALQRARRCALAEGGRWLPPPIQLSRAVYSTGHSQSLLLPESSSPPPLVRYLVQTDLRAAPIRWTTVNCSPERDVLGSSSWL